MRRNNCPACAALKHGVVSRRAFEHIGCEFDRVTVPLKNGAGSATFIGKPSREMVDAVNTMADLALDYIKNKKIKAMNEIKKLPIKCDTPCSENFRMAFMGGGTYCSIDCEHCGRTHFSGGSIGDYEEGELESLVAGREENPDKYILSGYECINYGYVNGKQLVFDCICNSGTPFERFFLSHASRIAELIRLDAQDKQSEADSAKEVFDKIKKALKLEEI